MDFEDNEVNLETNNVLENWEAVRERKIEKIYQPKKLFERDDISERQRLIDFIFNEGYDKRNYPTNMTVQVGLSIVKVDIVCAIFDLLEKLFTFFSLFAL